MKQLLLLFTLLLMISTEAIGQRSYRSSYSSSSRSYSRPSYSRPSYTKTTYSKPNYTKATVSKTIYKNPVRSTKIDGTKTIIKPIIKPIVVKRTSINNRQAYSNRYNNNSRAYNYNGNSISWSNLALMYYVVNYNRHTHRNDTIKAPNKQQLEKKVDAWTTTQK